MLVVLLEDCAPVYTPFWVWILCVTPYDWTNSASTTISSPLTMITSYASWISVLSAYLLICRCVQGSGFNSGYGMILWFWFWILFNVQTQLFPFSCLYMWRVELHPFITLVLNTTLHPTMTSPGPSLLDPSFDKYQRRPTSSHVTPSISFSTSQHVILVALLLYIFPLLFLCVVLDPLITSITIFLLLSLSHSSDCLPHFPVSAGYLVAHGIRLQRQKTVVTHQNFDQQWQWPYKYTSRSLYHFSLCCSIWHYLFHYKLHNISL